MQVIQNNVLTINGGSSSIRFAMYQTEGVLVPVLSGSIENINSQNTTFSFTNSISKEEKSFTIEINDFEESANYLADWLELQVDFSVIKAVGHRVVHGMQHTEAQRITAELLNELKEIRSYDPEHLPGEIKLIEIFTKRHPACTQVACFDTAFHTTMPHIAKLLPIPRKYFEMGIKRYGFHGLSYAYLMQELQRRAGKQTAGGKIILAHLGNGASLAAVKNGKCIDTSMGFTPTSGLVMGTRTGDLDPGVAWYLLQVEKLMPEKFNHLINHESGLLGVSATSADMKEIVKLKNTDTRAAEAFELFCYQAKKFVGAYTAALEGLDTLVFSGGIGEHSPEVRSGICDGMEFLGIELCEIKNMNNETIISAKTSKVTVYVIKTNEELMIAEMVCEVLAIQ
jgi:acetate kinase